MGFLKKSFDSEYDCVDLEVGSEAAAASQFHLTVEELDGIAENQDLQKIAALGGVPGIARRLGSDIHTGLPQSEITSGFAQRRAEYSMNVYPEPDPATFFQLMYEALEDPTMIILGVAALLALSSGMIEHPATGWIEGTAILSSILIVSLVTAFNNYEKELQFRQLNAVKNNRQVKVIRAGQASVISIFDINVGDIVQLDTGDQVPADGLFIAGYNLTVDESAMTGESDSVKKNDARPFFLSGCQVDGGVGTMLVTAVGMNSAWGKTLARLQQPTEQTPLECKLEALATRIGMFGTGIAVVVFMIRFAFWVYKLNTTDSELGFLGEDGILSHGGVLGFFLTAITIVVVAVPEGLPLAVALSLAYSVKKMLIDNNLVRRLEACETMGNATNICSDKTGTLTQNRMTVVKGVFGAVFHDEIPDAAHLNTTIRQYLVQNASVNSSESSYVQTDKDGRAQFVGNKTECALLMLSTGLNEDYMALRKAFPKRMMYAFSSDRKRMSCMARLPEGGFRLYTKGAAEIVLAHCTKMIDVNGQVVNLDESIRVNMLSAIDRMASNALRTISLAYRDFSEDGGEPWEHAETVEHELTLIAIVGINDPVRPEVPEAVRKCQRAGITVRMVTGDNILTAKDIARQCNILTEGGIAMEGREFRNLKPEEMDSILPRLQVLARSSPNDKYILVNRLRQLGEVVAVTGDGTNDAPALKEADVGFSMGIAGTEVAKEASDVVLMDDNFRSIVRAVVWGRSVYDSICKFVQFQLTVNVVACVMSFVAACNPHETELPLKPVQLLWVNLIMDSLGALALATEYPSEKLLERKPYGRNEPLISRTMWRNIIGQAIYQLLVLVAIYFKGAEFLGLNVHECDHHDTECVTTADCSGEEGDDLDECLEEYAASELTILFTFLFNSFVWCQIFNEVNSRKLGSELNPFDGMLKNPIFMSILFITAALQFLIVQFGGLVTSTAPLTLEQWGYSILLGAISLPVGFVLRMIKVARVDEGSAVPATSSASTTSSSSAPAAASDASVELTEMGGEKGDKARLFDGVVST